MRQARAWLAAAVATAACACGAPASRAVLGSPPPGVAWQYEVALDARGDLRATATFWRPFTGGIQVDDGAAPFLDEVEKDGVAVSAASVACDRPCRVRYRVRLAEAARAVHDVDVALAAGGALFAPPTSWLAHPDAPARAPAARFRFHVVVPPGDRFVTGVRPAAPGGEGDTYEAAVDALDESSFAGFGALRVLPIPAGSASIAAAVAPSLALSDETVTRWVTAEVAAVSAYLGRPPADHAVVFVVPGTQDVTRGKTFGEGGASVFVRVGAKVTAANALEDWVVAHELIHVGTPSLAPEHAWFAEGLATYVEPIARARAGLTTAEKVWAELVEGLPQGAPQPSDGGLDGARAFGRVYWGGALYFLLADLAIREQTAGGRSLDDAVRAWAAAGGTAEARWPLTRCIEDGDRATGTTVLRDLYARFGGAPAREDLAALFARLGVRGPSAPGGLATLDDAAPLAAIRRAITRAPGK